MKQSVQGLLIARMKGFDALIKDILSVLVCSQNFLFFCEKCSRWNVTRESTQSQNISENFFQPISTNNVSNKSSSFKLLILRKKISKF